MADHMELNYLSTMMDHDFSDLASNSGSPTRANWCTEEDEIVRKAVQDQVAMGKKPDWAAVSDAFSAQVEQGSLQERNTLRRRTSRQCRERWSNHLDPTLNKSPWTEKEDAILLTLQDQLGNKWSEIARSLPGRTHNDVKNRLHSITRQRKKSATSVVEKLEPVQDMLLDELTMSIMIDDDFTVASQGISSPLMMGQPVERVHLDTIFASEGPPAPIYPITLNPQKFQAMPEPTPLETRDSRTASCPKLGAQIPLSVQPFSQDDALRMPNSVPWWDLPMKVCKPEPLPTSFTIASNSPSNSGLKRKSELFNLSQSPRPLTMKRKSLQDMTSALDNEELRKAIFCDFGCAETLTIGVEQLMLLLQTHRLKQSSLYNKNVEELNLPVEIFGENYDQRMTFADFLTNFQICNRCTELKKKAMADTENIGDEELKRITTIIRVMPSTYCGPKVKACEHFQWTWCEGYGKSGNTKCLGTNRHDACPKYLANCTLWKHKLPPKQKKVSLLAHDMPSPTGTSAFFANMSLGVGSDLVLDDFSEFTQ